MKLTSDDHTKKKRLSKYKIVASILVGVFVCSIFATFVLASGTTTITPIQPVNKTISGTYEFEAKVVTSVSFADTIGNFTIDGTLYTATFAKTGTIDTYIAETGFDTGTLSNGAYSWYATVNGVKSSVSDFTIKNYITISPETPTSGSTIAGVYQFTVSTTTSGGETVSSVSMDLSGTVYPMTETSTNQWEYTINTFSIPNTKTTVAYSASGSDGVSGSTTISIIIDNPVSQNYKVEYLEGTTGYNTTLSAVTTSSTTTTEGFYSLNNAFLSLQPNSKVTSIIITTPDTVSGLHFYFLPFTISPYYKWSSGSGPDAYNWTSNEGSYLVISAPVNGATISTSTFGLPIYEIPGTGNTITYVSSPTGGNLIPTITSNWTVGGIFDALTNSSYLIGTSTLHFYALPASASTFYPAVNISTSAGTYYQIVSNVSMTTNTWFSMALGLMPQSNNLTKDTLWIDSTSVPTHIVGTITNGQTLNGMGNSMPLINVDFFDFWSSNSLLSTTYVSYLLQPAFGQMPSGINPPFYTVTQDYYQIQITNGSQPWSPSLMLNTMQFNGYMVSTATINLNSYFGYESFFSYNVNLTYSPYFSIINTSVTLNDGYFSIPTGSLIRITVSNVWNQIVAVFNTTIVTSTFNANIFLNIALLSFQFINATEQFITLTANNITEEFYAQAYVGMGYTYFWNSSVYVNSQNKIYFGNVTVTEINQPLIIYSNPPIVSLTVLAYAYNQSGLGAIGSLSAAGSPSINLFINNKPFQTGATYSTTIDSTVNVLITDQLNQTLYNENYTLQNVVNTLVVKITKPSWVLSITNDEQLAPKANSTLATEIVNITNKASGINHTFTNSVGQTLELYLLQGNYSLYLHDNATFKTSLDLNSSQFYVIFGQKLLTLNEWLNKTNEIINNSAKLDVVVLRQSTMMLPFVHTSFQFTITYPNGTALTNSQIKGFILNGSFVIYKLNSSIAQSVATMVVNSTIYANFTTGPVDSYTYVLQGHLIINTVTWGNRYSGNFEINMLTNTSDGLIIKMSGPSTIQINTTNVYTISLYYQLNNTPLSHRDTQRIFKNMTIDVFYRGVFFGVISPKYNATTNLITFTVNMSAIGSYIIDVVISPTNITSNAHAYGQLSPNINVQYANPYGPTTLQQIGAFIGQFGGYLGVAVTFAYVFVVAYRRIRRRRLAEEDDERSAETYEVSFAYKDLINAPSWEAVPPASKIIISRMKKDAIKKMTLDLLGQKNQQVNEIIREMRKANREAQKQNIETQLHFRRLRQDTDKAVGDVRGLSYDVKKRIDDVDVE